MIPQASRGVKAPRQPAATRVLERVRRILEETCEQDGQGFNLSESQRRKAYRAGINRALEAMPSSAGRPE